MSALAHVSLSQAAELLGVSTTWVAHLVAIGKLNAAQHPARTRHGYVLLFDRAEVLRLASDRVRSGDLRWVVVEEAGVMYRARVLSHRGQRVTIEWHTTATPELAGQRQIVARELVLERATAVGGRRGA